MAKLIQNWGYGAVPNAEHGAATSFSTLGDGTMRAAAMLSGKSKLIGGLAAGAVAIAAAAALGVTLSTKETTDTDWCAYTGYRLPQIAIPSQYRVYWQPQFAAPFLFNGSVGIDITVTQETDCILVHAADDIAPHMVSYGASPAVALSGGGSRASGFDAAATYSSTSPSLTSPWPIHSTDAATLTLTPLTVTTTTAPPFAAAASRVSYWHYDYQNERLIIRMPERLEPGQSLSLQINYTAPLGTSNTGLYLSQYSDDSGQTVSMVATQFEATYARHAFPCFDEPAYKANFSLAVDSVPPTYTAVGNMPVSNTQTNGDGTLMVSFQTTPKMSTYLVALVVGPLISVNGATPRGTTVHVYGVNRTATVGNLDFARDTAVFILNYYENLFGVPFPLPKSDMAAIPDFAAGAMENWGLITYRETALLANNRTSSAAELQRVAVVVSHELAHQWFGDIVTMDWWSALWLNEGFATKMEYVGVEGCCSQFEIQRQFQSGDILVGMRADAFADVQPLTQTVTSSAAIEGMFSSISYSKGGSILLMIQAFLDAFKPGSYYSAIHSYLTSHAYGNAAPTDLWSNFAGAAGIPALASWVSQYELRPGYALVSVDWAGNAAVRAASEASGVGVLTISQSRHFVSPYSQAIAGGAAASNVYWWIPLSLAGQHPAAAGPVPAAVTAAGSSASNPATAFVGKIWGYLIGSVTADPVTQYNLTRDGYIKANINGTGYYRVNYPPSLWRALGAAAGQQLLNNVTATATTTVLSPPDRGQIVDDLLTLAEGTGCTSAGVNTTLALSVIASFLPYDTSYEAWTPALYHLSSVLYGSLIIPDVPLASAGNPAVSPFDAAPGSALCAAAFASYARSMIEPLVAALGGFEGAGAAEVPLITAVRTSALNVAGTFNSTAVVTAARIYYAAGWYNAPVDVQSIILRIVSRWSANGDGVWESLKNDYIASNDASIKSRILGALAAPRDRSLLQQTLAFALTPDVRVGDRVSLITSVCANPFGRDMCWAFIKANWAALYASYGPGGFDLSNLVLSSGTYFASDEYRNDVLSFFRSNGIPGAVHDWNQAMESIGAHSLWRGSEAANTCAWLDANYASSGM